MQIRQDGRERYCRAELRKLKEVDKWLDNYRMFWYKKLDAPGEFPRRQDDDQ